MVPSNPLMIYDESYDCVTVHTPHSLWFYWNGFQRGNSCRPDCAIFVSTADTYRRLLCNVSLPSPPVETLSDTVPAWVAPSKNVLIFESFYRYVRAERRKFAFAHFSLPRSAFLSATLLCDLACTFWLRG